MQYTSSKLLRSNAASYPCGLGTVRPQANVFFSKFIMSLNSVVKESIQWCCEVKRTGLGPRKPKLRLNLLLSSVKCRGLLSPEIDRVIVKCSNHMGGSSPTSVWKWIQATSGLAATCPWWERYPTPSPKQTTHQPAVTLRKHKALLSFKYSPPTWTQRIY